MKNIREKILNEPSYWVESINGIMYDAIITFMEEKKMNRTELAEYLGISKGRVSQLLNNGEINFSIGKIIEIALKIGFFPIFNLENKKEYLEKNEQNSLNKKNTFSLLISENMTYDIKPKRDKKAKIISLKNQTSTIENIFQYN